VDTWRIEVTRENGTFAVTTADQAPDWVFDLVNDLSFRIRQAPEIRRITVDADAEPIAAAAGRPMTDAEVTEALSEPEAPSPATTAADQVIPDAAAGPTPGGLPPGAVDAPTATPLDGTDGLT
jgi:hypothetical protein